MHASWIVVLSLAVGQYTIRDQPEIRQTAGDDAAPAYSAVREAAPAVRATQPAGVAPRNNSVAPIRSAAASSETGTAAALIRHALQLPQGVQVDELGVRDVLAQRGDAGSRLGAVRSYWSLVDRAARLRFADEELIIVHAIDGASATLNDKAEIADVEARAADAELQLLRSQLEVAAMLGRPQGGDLPFPVDLPLAGVYHTRYEAMFSGRQAPAPLWRLHQTLPQQQRLVKKRAVAEQLARQSLLNVRRDYQGGRATAGDLLAALKRLRQQRSAFLDDLQSYNHSIAEYAMRSVGGGTPLDRLVTTMIVPRPGTSEARALRDGVLQASAESPAGFRARGQAYQAASDRPRLTYPR